MPKDRAKNRRLREQQQAAGLCGCGKPTATHRRMCDGCRRKISEYSRRKRLALESAAGGTKWIDLNPLPGVEFDEEKLKAEIAARAAAVRSTWTQSERLLRMEIFAGERP